MKYLALFPLISTLALTLSSHAEESLPQTLTPPVPAQPRINGPSAFGVRPGSPVLYFVPASGECPMSYQAEKLPAGLRIDSETGAITGKLLKAGKYPIVLHATNSKGEARRIFKIIVGDRIALTPPMGWCSWNCMDSSITQEKILRAARLMVSSGLSRHGYSYVNMDDGWQGERTGPGHALMGNAKFPNLQDLPTQIHQLGLKAGIYSTPCQISYAKFTGGSGDAEDGKWTKVEPMHLGKYSFAEADAKQFAAMGFDSLKYDWNITVPPAEEMRKALLASGRDILLSLSNKAPFRDAGKYMQLAEMWRTTGDILDVWKDGDNGGGFGVSEIAFSQDRWAPYVGPGHWIDPDMLVVGNVKWGKQPLHPTHLTPDQQYSHISMWCLLSAPLLIGCDLESIDPFTLGLLTNDEVLAIDQDELGQQAVRVGSNGPVDFYSKYLSDDAFALGIFNRGDSPQTVSLSKMNRTMGIWNKTHARDLWRQVDVPDFSPKTKFTIPAGGVILLKVMPNAQRN
jgi:alpha-galactosidase